MKTPDIRCPVGGCRTVEVFYGIDEGYKLTAYYCPRCDAVLGVLSAVSGDSPGASVEWHREGSELMLRPREHAQWHDLSEPVRETWEKCVRHFVETFLRDRTSEKTFCFSDFEDTRIIHAETDERGGKWRFSWCDQCNSGVLWAYDPDYGWELCFTLLEEGDDESYRIILEHAPVVDYPTARDVLRRLPAIGRASG